MTNTSTKRALLSSVLALFLCFVMLMGTTFAWFTDEATSANNMIKTGTLDIGWSYKNLDDTAWTDITDANEAIFNYDKWEPGYIDAKQIKITNNGTLALKYRLDIIPNITPADGEVDLADVIDVYMFDVNATINRDTVAAATPVGTLSELMVDADGAAYGILLPAEGVGSEDFNTSDNAPRGEVSYCIVLKMREEAGNEYQDLSVGGGFALQLLATQYTWENDSFDHLYDDDADFNAPPRADVQVTSGKMISTSTHGDIWANTTFQFQPNETLEEAQKNPYKLYHADFVVSADKDIAPNTIVLPGYYSAYCDDHNDGKWLGLSSDDTIAANTELRLIQILGEALGGSITVNYEDICKWGNDGVGFLCGVSAADLDNDGIYDAAGTTITVELRLYEVPAQGECAEGGGCKHPYYDCETGADNYITIGTYTYTVPTEVETQP